MLGADDLGLVGITDLGRLGWVLCLDQDPRRVVFFSRMSDRHLSSATPQALALCLS